MSDIVERLRATVKDADDWNGSVMQRWDQIRGQVTSLPGSDLPRMNFEDLIENFTEILTEAANEIERLRGIINTLDNNLQVQISHVNRLRAASLQDGPKPEPFDPVQTDQANFPAWPDKPK